MRQNVAAAALVAARTVASCAPASTSWAARLDRSR
jgi:hypothetical protein